MKIVVIAGGNSTERDVSLITGMGVYNALKEKGHNVILLDVYLGVKDVDAAHVFEDDRDWAAGIKNIGEKCPDMDAVHAMKNGDKDFFGVNVIDICKQADMVFMALHGANGEDGRIQAAFDLMGIRYTGTDYLSSAICMDKAVTKEFFRLKNVPTPASECVAKGEAYQEKADKIGFPMVVKVCNGGSSVGVSIVADQSALKTAMEDSFRYGETVLFEQYIKGREFTCGVVEGRALPIVEIAPVEGFYDYKNKYQAGSTIETCPAKISKELTEKIQREAEHVFEVLKLKTYARIDFLTDEEENIYCLEANTLPGMTPTSLLPQEAGVEGMDYSSLCEHIIEISLKKYQ